MTALTVIVMLADPVGGRGSAAILAQGETPSKIYQVVSFFV